jgi:hypothetical protein
MQSFNIYGDDYDYEGEFDEVMYWISISFFYLSQVASSVVDIQRRDGSIFLQRLCWHRFLTIVDAQGPSIVTRFLRMPMESFNRLFGYLQTYLQVDEDQAAHRGGAILPQIRLFCALRYLAGASYLDIIFFIGISKQSFYRVVWQVIDAINMIPQLQFHFPTTFEECADAAASFEAISYGKAISNCCLVVDGYLARITAPVRRLAGNVRSYFSGHYQCYGVNCQAAFDSLSRFIFFAVAGPGNMGDREALYECGLGQLIDRLPGHYVAILDCAYMPTDHAVPLYCSIDRRQPFYDNFNYFASQRRIRAEMGFGLMYAKWGILWRPLCCDLTRVRCLMTAIARLHNFVIDERILSDGLCIVANEIEMRRLPNVDERDDAAEGEAGIQGVESICEIRTMMAERIKELGYERPM